jgi:hypothetical protein
MRGFHRHPAEAKVPADEATPLHIGQFVNREVLKVEGAVLKHLAEIAAAPATVMWVPIDHLHEAGLPATVPPSRVAKTMSGRLNDLFGLRSLDDVDLPLESHMVYADRPLEGPALNRYVEINADLSADRAMAIHEYPHLRDVLSKIPSEDIALIVTGKEPLPPAHGDEGSSLAQAS